MRTRQHDHLLEDRVDDLARRLRAIEERLGEIAKQDADAALTERHQAKPYLTAAEAADYLGLSASLMNRWRCDMPGGPPYRKVGRRVVYARADLDQFLEERCRSRPLFARPSQTPVPGR